MVGEQNRRLMDASLADTCARSQAASSANNLVPTARELGILLGERRQHEPSIIIPECCPVSAVAALPLCYAPPREGHAAVTGRHGLLLAQQRSQLACSAKEPA